MALNENDRLEFQAWLIRNDLEERIAHAIMDTMAPYNWHEQATTADVAAVKADVAEVKADLASFKSEVGHRFDLMDQRFDGMDQRFETMEHQMRSNQTIMNSRFDSLAKDLRVVTLAMLGFLVTLVVAMIGGGVTLLVS